MKTTVSKKLYPLEESIINELSTLKGKDEIRGINKRWTEAVKDALCNLGKKNGYQTYASSCKNASGGEWLYDVTWLEYKDKKVQDSILVAESEWTPSGVDMDFQKLLLAKADV